MSSLVLRGVSRVEMPTISPTLGIYTRKFASQKIVQRQFDVVIVGSGPVGLALAAGLQSNPVTQSLKVGLLDIQDTMKLKDWKFETYSNRCSSLTNHTRMFFDKIGAWDFARKDRIQPFQHILASDGLTNSSIHLDQKPGSEPMAFMSENVNLQYALLNSIIDKMNNNIKKPNLEFLMPCTITKLSKGENIYRTHIHTTTHGELTTKLLIGADGRNSIVRKYANISMPGWNYPTHAVVGTLKVDPLEGPAVAFQRFLPTGPLAYLPLPDNNATFVWSTRPHIASKLLRLPEETFVKFLNASFRLDYPDLSYLYQMDFSEPSKVNEQLDWRLQVKRNSNMQVPPVITEIVSGSRAAFPLRLAHVDEYVKEGIALCGDAAHNTHPLAGQGLNTGIQDVESLISALSFAIKHGQDIGSVFSLQPYFRDRYFKNHVYLGVVDKFHKLYAMENPVVTSVRTLGLSLFDRSASLKNFILSTVANGI